MNQPPTWPSPPPSLRPRSRLPTGPAWADSGEAARPAEVRQAAQAEPRLKEAAKLGFDAATLPRRVAHGNRKLLAPDGLHMEEIGHIADLVTRFAPARTGSRST